MSDSTELKQQIKQAMVEELMLPQTADEISDEAPIFSPQGLALDSVDALQLVVAIEKRFGLKIANAEAARTVMQNVNSIAEAITANRS